MDTASMEESKCHACSKELNIKTTLKHGAAIIYVCADSASCRRIYLQTLCQKFGVQSAHVTPPPPPIPLNRELTPAEERRQIFHEFAKGLIKERLDDIQDYFWAMTTSRDLNRICVNNHCLTQAEIFAETMALFDLYVLSGLELRPKRKIIDHLKKVVPFPRKWKRIEASLTGLFKDRKVRLATAV